MSTTAFELEQRYYKNLQQDNRLLKMACVFTAAAVVFICVVWDWLWLEQNPSLLLDIFCIRLISSFIPLGILLTVLFTGWGVGLFNKLTQITIVIVSLGIAATNYIGLDYGYGSIMQPLMLVSLFGYFFTSLTWKEKVLVVWPLLFLVAGFDLLCDLGKDQLIYDMVYLTLVNLMGSVSCISNQRMGINNLEIQMRLEQMAETDPLTSLDNRYSFERKFEALAASEAGCGMAIAIADLDHFKAYNDCYGHMEGDQCLVQISQLLKDKTAEHDLVARLGGEEFVLLLHDLSFEEARLRAIKITQSVKGLAIDHWGSTTDSVVTMSMGLVWSDAVLGRERRTLMEMADRALYMAKQRRDNCVCMTSEQAQDILPKKSLY